MIYQSAIWLPLFLFPYRGTWSALFTTWRPFTCKHTHTHWYINLLLISLRFCIFILIHIIFDPKSFEINYYLFFFVKKTFWKSKPNSCGNFSSIEVWETFPGGWNHRHQMPLVGRGEKSLELRNRINRGVRLLTLNPRWWRYLERSLEILVFAFIDKVWLETRHVELVLEFI